MAKKKQLFKTFFFSAFLTMNAAASAYCTSDLCYDPAPVQCCWAGFDVSVDFIWWKLCREDLDYAVSFDHSLANSLASQSLNSKGTYKLLHSKWDPGVRVRGVKEDLWCGVDLVGNYTYISTCISDKVAKPDNGHLEATLIDAIVVPGNMSLDHVRASYKLTYQSFDLLFATDYCLRQCHNFRPYFGVSGVVLNQEEHCAGYLNQPLQVTAGAGKKWKDSYIGVGLKIGSEFNWHIFEGLSLYANGAGMAAVGDHDGSNIIEANLPFSGNINYDLRFNECECLLVPGYHIGIGFLYEICYYGCYFGVRFGYEFLEWQNVPNIRRFPVQNLSDAGMSTSPTVDTLGFHGLFAGLDLRF